MPPIDFSEFGDRELLREPLNVEINALIERGAAMELPRGYLGASAVGECLRRIQFDWWCQPMISDRVRLIFNRGHFFEAEAKKRLLNAGFTFAPKEALAFTTLEGYLQGHADGVITAGPTLPGVTLALPCVWECKALNVKNFRAVARDGLAKAFPRYLVQVQLYQHCLDKLKSGIVHHRQRRYLRAPALQAAL